MKGRDSGLKEGYFLVSTPLDSKGLHRCVVSVDLRTQMGSGGLRLRGSYPCCVFNTSSRDPLRLRRSWTLGTLSSGHC